MSKKTEFSDSECGKVGPSAWENEQWENNGASWNACLAPLKG